MAPPRLPLREVCSPLPTPFDWLECRHGRSPLSDRMGGPSPNCGTTTQSWGGGGAGARPHVPAVLLCLGEAPAVPTSAATASTLQLATYFPGPLWFPGRLRDGEASSSHPAQGWAEAAGLVQGHSLLSGFPGPARLNPTALLPKRHSAGPHEETLTGGQVRSLCSQEPASWSGLFLTGILVSVVMGRGAGGEVASRI